MSAEGLVAALNQAGVRYVVIGVAGANYWARSGHTVFTTLDFDIFLPPDPENGLKAWQAAEVSGLDLFSGDEPLDRPRDAYLAERIVERRALVRATDGRGFDADFSLVMAGFDFETVFARQRTFFFLASHAEALRALIDDEI